MKAVALRGETGKVMQYHIDPSAPETFVVGRLLFVFEDSFILHLISPNGKWDGTALIQLEDLVLVERATEYLDTLNLLLMLQKQEEPEKPQKANTGLETVLAYAAYTEKMIALELYQSGSRDIVGMVLQQKRDVIEILQLDELGREDGITCVRPNAVTRVYCDDEDLSCKRLLWDYHTTKSL